jgi:hypothetical protein
MAVGPSEAPRRGARAVTSSWTDSFNFTFRRRQGERDTATKDTPTFDRDVNKSQHQRGIKSWLDFRSRLSLSSALKVVVLLAATALMLWRTIFWSVKEPLRIRKCPSKLLSTPSSPPTNSETRVARARLSTSQLLASYHSLAFDSGLPRR